MGFTGKDGTDTCVSGMEIQYQNQKMTALPCCFQILKEIEGCSIGPRAQYHWWCPTCLALLFAATSSRSCRPRGTCSPIWTISWLSPWPSSSISWWVKNDYSKDIHFLPLETPCNLESINQLVDNFLYSVGALWSLSYSNRSPSSRQPS